MGKTIEANLETGNQSFAVHAASPRANNHSKGRALVIDDSVDITLMLDTILRRAGYETYTAFTGADALRAARSMRFDLVLSDIGMPLMNGYELCAELRKMVDYRGVPLVAITGYSHYEDQDQASACGFDALLKKPIDPSNLLAVLDRLRPQPEPDEKSVLPA